MLKKFFGTLALLFLVASPVLAADQKADGPYENPMSMDIYCYHEGNMFSLGAKIEMSDGAVRECVSAKVEICASQACSDKDTVTTTVWK